MVHASDLVLVISAPGRCSEVVSALRDWVGAGYAQPFARLVVDPETVVDPFDLEVTLVGGGAGRQDVTAWWQELVGSMPSDGTVRLVHLDDLAAPSGLTLSPLADALESSGITHECVRLHLWPDRQHQPQTSFGWRDLVLSAEDSAQPGAGIIDILPTRGHAGAIYYAPAVAALAGLVVGQEDTPTAGLNQADQRAVGARAFIRHLDADELELELAARVQAVADDLPLPRQDSSSATTVTSVSLATSEAAQSWWQRHRERLRGPRQSLPTVVSSEMGVIAALKLFFSFMAKALVGAPGAWARHIAYTTKARIADGVAATVFGEGSGIDVVVGGVSSGRSRLFESITSAEKSLAQLPDLAPEHQVHFEEGPMYRDLVECSLTLADAGVRSAGNRPVEIGGQRAIIRTPGLIAPAPQAQFSLRDRGVAHLVGADAVPATDMVEARAVQRRLEREERSPQSGLAAGNARSALESWTAEQRGTFTGAAMGLLADHLEHLLAEVARNHRVLVDALGQQGLDGLEDVERGVRRRVTIWLLLGLLALIVVAVLVGLGVLVMVVGALIAGLSIVSSLAGAFMSFYRGMHEVFQIKHRHELAVAQAPAAQANFVQAIRDAKRSADAYTVALRWSGLVGHFLSDPLPAGHEDRLTRGAIVSRLPQSVRLGRPVSTPERMAEVTSRLRQLTYTTGWLQGPWEAFARSGLAAVGESVGYDASIDDLYRQRAIPEHTALDSWTAELAAGLTHDGAREQWVTTRQALVDSPDLLDRLIDRVEIPRPGDPSRAVVVESPSSFRSLLERPDVGNLAERVMSERAVFAGANRVDRAWTEDRRAGLSQTLILIQCSAPIEAGQFVQSAPGWSEAPAVPDDDLPDVRF